MTTIEKIDAVLAQPGAKPNYLQLTLGALAALTREDHPAFSACFSRILAHLEAQPFMQSEAARAATP